MLAGGREKQTRRSRVLGTMRSRLQRQGHAWHGHTPQLQSIRPTRLSSCQGWWKHRLAAPQCSPPECSIPQHGCPTKGMHRRATAVPVELQRQWNGQQLRDSRRQRPSGLRHRLRCMQGGRLMSLEGPQASPCLSKRPDQYTRQDGRSTHPCAVKVGLPLLV